MRNIILLLILIILFSAVTKGQVPSFKNDDKFKKENNQGLTFINPTKLKDYDFQLRFYFGPLPYHLLLITYKNGAWSNDLYTFHTNHGPYIESVDSSHIVIKSYSSLFRQLKKDSLLTMTTLDESQFYKMAEKRKSAKNGMALPVDGPGPYLVELLSPSANRGFRSQCPETNYENYHLTELRVAVALFKKLMALVNMKPC